MLCILLDLRFAPASKVQVMTSTQKLTLISPVAHQICARISHEKCKPFDGDFDALERPGYPKCELPDRGDDAGKLAVA